MFPPINVYTYPFSVHIYKKKKLQVEGPFYKMLSPLTSTILRGAVITPRPLAYALLLIMYQTSHPKLYITNQSYFSSLRERYNKHF